MFSCGRRHTENKGTVTRVIQERCGHAGTSAAKGHREEGLEDTCYVRKAGTLQPEEEKAQEDLLDVCIYLVGMSEEDRAKLFSVVHSDRTSGNGHKMKYREFHLNRRKKKFTVMVNIFWNMLPREAVEFPSLQAFKTYLETVLNNLL